MAERERIAHMTRWLNQHRIYTRIRDSAVTMMVCRSLADGQIWTRPKQAFFEQVAHQGQSVPRFAAVAG